MIKNKIITIDGPAGSGKSTVAKILAKKLEVTYIDSGALYRAFAWMIKQKKLDINNLEKLPDFNVKYLWLDGKAILELDGIDLTEKIRDEEISKLTSECATKKNVRDLITNIQREIAKNRNIILDGRDAGTTVFPDADVKFFLNASLDERARRRTLELTQKGQKVDFETVKKMILERDCKDETRHHSPLAKAKNAIEIDTTDRTIQQIVENLMEKLK